MPAALVIAEKPSAARDIAKALAVPAVDRSHFANADYVITAASGHLNEIYNPAEETADGKKVKGFAKWSAASLPVLPERFELRPIKDAGAKLKQIKKLAKGAPLIINACDPAREGELIFHYIKDYLGLDAPVKRLWLQSMTAGAIKSAFADLRDHGAFKPLRDAAIARSEADWLVGINATRSLTVRNSREGGFQMTHVGRVQTPTLALLVARERERRAHVPRDYWELSATFAVAAGSYVGKWVDPEATSERGRVWDQGRANAIEATLGKGAAGVASDASKERSVAPPGLYDLNTLQREANRAHGFPARMTLSAAQALYERHKVLTYPRTESRFLPADYVGECERALASLGASRLVAGLAPHAKASIGRVAGVGRKVFDQSKVTDHFAIIPTGTMPEAPKLKDFELKVFEMVCRRFVAAFMPPAKVRDNLRTTVVGAESFETRGKVVVAPGWYAAAKPSLGDVELPALAGESEAATVTEASCEAKKTQPPRRYDDAALLGAMQKAAKFVDDDELSGVLSEVGGIGTPATRASIIEDLVTKKYVTREQRELIPSSRSERLIKTLEDMDIEALATPELTGKWEHRLRAIEQGDESKDKFLADIRELAGKVCKQALEYDPDNDREPSYLDTPCPSCGKQVAIRYNKYACVSCDYFIWNVIGRRPLAPAEAQQLISAGQAGPFEDFLDRFGNEFAASVSVDESGKPSLVFSNDRDDEFANPDNLEYVGPCPIEGCDGRVLASESQFRCSESIASGNGKPSCDFRLARTICKRKLSLEEGRKLIVEGRSDLLENFISKRNRPFKAYLLLDAKGKLSFEFEPRPAKKGARKPAAKKAGAKRARARKGKQAATVA